MPFVVKSIHNSADSDYYTEMMTVTLPDPIERQVTKFARDQDVTPDELVQKAIQAYIQAEASQITGLSCSISKGCS